MARSALDSRSFFRNPQTGRLTIVQVPNLALTVFLVASVIRRLLHPSGVADTIVSVVAGAALVWWAVQEIRDGDSPFRRVLGAVVLAASVLGWLLR